MEVGTYRREREEMVAGMAYIRPDGRAKVRAFSRPAPRYDFEPAFLNEPDEVSMRRQLADLIGRAIRMADGEGLDLESGNVPDEWRLDWGQRIASGTYRQEVERLVADIPAAYVEKVLLRSFYRAVMEMIGVGGESLTCLMGIHALEGVVSNPTREFDSIQLSFTKGDPILDGMGNDGIGGDGSSMEEDADGETGEETGDRS